MMRNKILLSAGLLALLAAAPPAQASSTSGLWVHVKVDDGDEKVRVNVPLSLVENLLPAIDTDEMRGGRLRIDALDVDELNGVDLEEMWRAIQEVGDAEFVTVQGDDENVRVYTQGNYLLIEVDNRRGEETALIRFPLAVVDALFSGPPGELNLLAAVQALGAHGDGDLVQVRDGRTTVRVWIDGSNSTD